MTIYINDSSVDSITGIMSQTLAGVTASMSGTNDAGPPDADGALNRALHHVTSQFINPGYNFPRLMSLAVGGGGVTSQWTQTAEGSETAAVACHMIAVINFDKPSQGSSVEQAAVQTLRNWNPSILLSCYKDPSAINNSGYEFTNYYPDLTTEFTYSGSGGATDGDGLSRESDGTIVSSVTGKYDVMMGDFSSEWNGYLPGEWLADIRYDESYGTGTGANYDFIYWDVQDWMQRETELTVDMNRDGTAEYDDGGYDVDGNNDVWGPAKLAVKARIFNRINNKHLTAYGTTLEHFGSIGSWFHHDDGYPASGNTLLESSQPSGINNYIQGGQVKQWAQQFGYDEDGSLNGQTFENGFKSISRQLAYMKTSTLVASKWVCADFWINRSVSTRYTVVRYGLSAAVIAGAWFCWHDQPDSSAVGLMDEYVADDIDNMTVAQVRAATGWLGQPVGPDPGWGTTFVEGSQGGKVSGTGSIGVYMREFENGLVICNPLGNGTQNSIPLPGNVGDYAYFSGGQDAVWNSGNDITSATIAMPAATGLFLKHATSAWGYPIVFALTIGGKTDAGGYLQTAPFSETWKQAVHDIAVVNFNYPADISAARAGVANLRSINPNLIIGHYTDNRSINWNPTDTNYDQLNYQPVLEDEFFTAGSGGAVDGDGMMRKVNGELANLISSGPAGTFKYACSLGTYAGLGSGPDATGMYAHEWLALKRWEEWWSVAAALGIDWMFMDVNRWIIRDDAEGQVDLDRDGTVEDYDYDASVPGSLAENIGISIRAAMQRCKDQHLATYGKPLILGGNDNANWDWHAQARADTGPNYLTAAVQPAGLQALKDWGYLEHIQQDLAYNHDGTDRASGNWTRFAKQASRLREYLKVNPITGTKVMVLECNLDKYKTSLSATQQRKQFRYYAGAATLMGGTITLEQQQLHKETFLLDEVVAGDIESMTTAAQVEAGKHWLGQPIGNFPTWDLNATGEAAPNFIQNTQGGIVSNNVWAMEFDGGLVLVNPKGNGTETITLPSGSWKRFSGGQDPSINNGASVGSTIQLGDAVAIFLERA